MLPYRRESPALPRCLVQGGRVVHGPQFAFCPSPQGRCPQPSSSSCSSQCWAQLCCWPDPGLGSTRLCSAGWSPQGWGHNAGAPSPQLCTGCRVPMPVPSPSGQCLALITASPALGRPGAWVRAESGTSWMRCPGRGPGWAWRSCRSQVRPPGWWAQSTQVGEHPRDLPEAPRGALGCQESPSFAPGTGSNSSSLPCSASPCAGTPAGHPAWQGVCWWGRPSAPQGAAGRVSGNMGGWHKVLKGRRRWRGPREWWHSWGHKPCPTEGHERMV